MGDASKPGGLDGEGVLGGRSMTIGEQKSIRSGQPEASMDGDALVVSRLERGDGFSTEVGESGGEAGGLRPSKDRRRPALGEH